MLRTLCEYGTSDRPRLPACRQQGLRHSGCRHQRPHASRRLATRRWDSKSAAIVAPRASSATTKMDRCCVSRMPSRCARGGSSWRDCGVSRRSGKRSCDVRGRSNATQQHRLPRTKPVRRLLRTRRSWQQQPQSRRRARAAQLSQQTNAAVWQASAHTPWHARRCGSSMRCATERRAP